jgi:tryptophan-rich sensory protein
LGERAGRAVLALGPVVIVGVLGSLATLPNIPTWYAGLEKPPFTPPNGLFGPAWSLLYGMMAYALWRVLARPATAARRQGIIAYFVQLGLNALWSWSFFALHSPAFGLAVILALLAAIIATIALFRRVDGVAAGLLLPYLAWVLFATYLNTGVWWLNR